MTELLSVSEGAPASYPNVPQGVSTAAWQRIEGWISHRWAERSVTWIVMGPGVFELPLKPATVETQEVWNGETYEPVTLEAGPIGFLLDARTYRITATVGATADPPAAVQTAVQRLSEYMAQAEADPALGHSTATDGDYSFTRPASWAARAIHYSGAADLLRSFR